MRDDKAGLSCFTVTIPDRALMGINQGLPLRALTIRFNGMGRPSDRLLALAQAVRQFEDEGVAYPGLVEVIRRKIKRWFSRK